MKGISGKNDKYGHNVPKRVPGKDIGRGNNIPARPPKGDSSSADKKGGKK